MNAPQGGLGAGPDVTTRLSISHTDDPRVIAEQRNDDYANHVVPMTVRLGRWKLTMTFWSVISAMVWLFYGALAASLFGTMNAIISMFAAVAFFGVANYFLTKWAIRTGLNATLLSRQVFGVFGSIFIAALLAANMIYYTVFESSTLAVAFHHYTPDWNIAVWYAIVCLGMLPLMLGSAQTFMARLNGFLLPFFYLGLIVTVVVVAIRFPIGDAWLSFEGVVPPESRAYPGWVLGFMLYLGLCLNSAMSVDLGRFGKLEDEKFHRHITFGWVFSLLLFVVNGVAGIFLVQSVIPNEPAAETGVVTAILLSTGFFGLIFIVISQTRVNTLNYYEASANASRAITGLFGIRVSRLLLVMAITVVVFLLMLTNVFSYIERMLGWQASFMVGWVGILLMHYFLSGGFKNTEFRVQRVSKFTMGTAAWLISAAVGIFLSEWTAAPEKLSAIAPLVALVVSMALYTAGYLLVKKMHEKRNHQSLYDAGDIRDEVEDPWGAYVLCDSCDRSYVAYEMDRKLNATEPQAICDACAVSQKL